MNKYVSVAVVGLSMLNGAFAADQSADLISSKSKIAPKTLEFLEATEISGYVQTSYQHSWGANGSAAGIANDPGVTPGRVFNNNRNSFDIDQVKLTLEKPIGDGDYGAGYRVDFLYGNAAKAVNMTSVAATHNESFIFDNTSALEQAYVQFRIPVGTGLEVKVGRFVTLLGNEGIDAPGNWNYSHSYIFAYALPYTHTGALMSYKWNDIVDTQLAVVNGWDDVQDNNSGKSVMGRVGVKLLGGKLNLATVAIGGPEQYGNNSNYRYVIDEIITYNPTEKLSFALEGVYGHEQFSGSEIAGDGLSLRDTAQWWGVAGYAKYQWMPQLSTAFRAEYFSDEGGTRLNGSTGMLNTLPYTCNAQEYTLSFQFDNIWKNLTPRVELRYDHIDHQLYSSDGNQGIFSASVDFIYAF